MEKELTRLERLYLDMKNLELFMKENNIDETDKAVKLLEVKNCFIGEKNALLMKVQRISKGDDLRKIQLLNHLLSFAYGFNIITRKDSTLCFRLRTPNKQVEALYKQYDNLYNQRYSTRMLKLIRNDENSDRKNLKVDLPCKKIQNFYH